MLRNPCWKSADPRTLFLRPRHSVVKTAYVTLLDFGGKLERVAFIVNPN